jgi:3-dehydroquinate synthase
MSQIEVKIPSTPQGSYRIHIGTGTLGSVWGRLDEDFGGLGRFVITDSDVAGAGHLSRLLGGREVGTYVIDPAGEESKHIGTLTAIIEAMEKAFLGRDTLVVALGGGTVGDIAGFAAAVFKRGVKVVHIPTTTVSQADSSVGGKTGVDSSMSKNAYGAFQHPAGVYIDVETLRTLDEREYRAGLVESVKHALIADAEYFEYLGDNIEAILARDNGVLEEVAYRNCSIKAAVVAEDPLEKNKRRILNFGHTIGHAIESVSRFEFLHGEAVAVGIAGAELIAQDVLGAPAERLDAIAAVLGRLGVPLKIPRSLQKEALFDIIRRDKKAVSRWPRFVLLEDVGVTLCKDGQWAHEVGREVVEDVIDRLYE